MLFAAIIGDIVNSRNMPDRNMTQNLLRKMIEQGNETFENDLAAKFTLTLGDEFEVLLVNISASYRVIDFAREYLYPHKIKVGIGVGEIHTSIDKNSSGLNDGPAFHRAREAVEQAKKSKNYTLLKADLPGVELINALAYFVDSCRNRMTANQFKAFLAMNKLKTQQKAAEHLDITQSSISKALASAYYYEISNAQNRIERYLQEKFPLL